MLAAVLHGPRDLRVEEVERPSIGPREVLVRVKACGVCTTDLHMYLWEFPVKTPVILGHEFSGEIVQVGKDVHDLLEGDRVAVDPVLSCGLCNACVAGRDNLCERLRAVGGAGDVIVNGAFAEYTLVPREAVGKIPPRMSFDEGAFVEPLGCCIHGIDESRVRAGETVALIGAGPIGLLLLQLTRAAGAAQIVVADLKDDRLELAKELGADVAVNSSREDLRARLTELTHGEGADLVIEAVGSPLTVKQSVEMVKKGGRVTIFGVPPVGSKVDLSPFDIYFREIAIVGVYAITRDTFRRSIAMLGSGRVRIDRLITERFALNDIVKALTLAEKKAGLKKVIYP
jgi:L-iditol 2-dehydrogenase